MTTPESDPAAPASGPASGPISGPASAPIPRVTRPEPVREGPNRKPEGAPPPEAPAQSGVRDPDVSGVNEAVASTVRSAYDVLGETIKQGRRAAEQFRTGAYNVRDVPDDVRHMAGNLLGLARQLSSATFDICEALLRQTGGAMTPPPPGSTVVPPFPSPKAEPAPPTPSPSPAAPDMRLTVQFTGSDKASAHSTSLARPAAPTAPEQIACDGLASRGSGAPAITGIAFAADPAGGGLVATVNVPPDQPGGVYTGAVYCTAQALPLGQLVIEIG